MILDPENDVFLSDTPAGFPPECSSSLDALEISAQHWLDPSPSQCRFFRGMSPHREYVVDAFLRSTDQKHQKRAEKLKNCCRHPYIYPTEGGSCALSTGRCKDRLCPRCSRIRALKLEQTATEIIRRMPTKRFITLTIKHLPGEALDDAIVRLKSSYKMLTRRRLWRQHVTGGFYCVEIGFNVQSGTWHPHMHIVASGDFIPQASLAAEWFNVTGNSKIVDIRAIHSPASTARYISKYVLKSVMVEGLPHDRLLEFANATHGLRMYQTFGEQHRQTLKEKTTMPPPIKGLTYASIGECVTAYQTGNPVAERLFMVLRGMPRSWRLAFGISDSEAATPVETEETEAPQLIADLMHELTRWLRHGPPPPPQLPPPQTLYD